MSRHQPPVHSRHGVQDPNIEDSIPMSRPSNSTHHRSRVGASRCQRASKAQRQEMLKSQSRKMTIVNMGRVIYRLKYIHLWLQNASLYLPAQALRPRILSKHSHQTRRSLTSSPRTGDSSSSSSCPCPPCRPYPPSPSPSQPTPCSACGSAGSAPAQRQRPPPHPRRGPSP